MGRHVAPRGPDWLAIGCAGCLLVTVLASITLLAHV